MLLDINNSNKRKVLCISNRKDNMMMYCDNHHLLEVGKEYTVEDVDVHDWYTLVYLEEFPNVEFNSVIFEEMEGYWNE